jgi:hypothetical protein
MLRLVSKSRKKYYWIDQVHNGDTHIVKAYHGKQGEPPNTHVVFEGNEAEAKEAFTMKQIEKIEKGYSIM